MITMDEINSYVVLAVLLSGLSIGIFFITRLIACWYFRINEIVKNQETANKLLSNLIETLANKSQNNVSERVIEFELNQSDKDELQQMLINKNE